MMKSNFLILAPKGAKLALNARTTLVLLGLRHAKASLHDMSRDMKFPTMWFVQPAKPQIGLSIQQSKNFLRQDPL